MKSAIFFGLMTVASADVCTNPDATRDEYIEGLCCSRTCLGVCSADTECVSGDCREKCCVTDLSDENCVTCNDEGSCASCSDGFSLLSAFHPDAGAIVQEGSDLLHSDGDTEFGQSLAMSKDGSVIAIGAYKQEPSTASTALKDAGVVRVYELISGAWQQRGSDIEGGSKYAWSGYSVDLNEDGSVVAIGVPRYSIRDDSGSVVAGGSMRGQARIFDWSDNAWVQRGDGIQGEVAKNFLGGSVSLSADANTVAVGAPDKQGLVLTYSGVLTVYYWNGAAWQQKGNIIEGSLASDRVGKSISLSADGNRIAYTKENSDTVDVLTWENGAWGNLKSVQLDYLSSVDLSPDGSTIAVAAKRAREDGILIGNVKVFQFDQSGNLVQRGGDLNDFLLNAGDAGEIGSSVNLNKDGTAIAISATKADSSTLTDAGHIAVFDWGGEAWTKRSDILGNRLMVKLDML